MTPEDWYDLKRLVALALIVAGLIIGAPVWFPPG